MNYIPNVHILEDGSLSKFYSSDASNNYKNRMIRYFFDVIMHPCFLETLEKKGILK